MRLTIDVPDELAEVIAAKVAALLTDQAGPANPDPPDRLLTVEEAATYLRAKPQRVYDLINQGRIETERDGRRVLIRRGVIDRYLNTQNNNDRSTP